MALGGNYFLKIPVGMVAEDKAVGRTVGARGEWDQQIILQDPKLIDLHSDSLGHLATHCQGSLCQDIRVYEDHSSITDQCSRNPPYARALILETLTSEPEGEITDNLKVVEACPFDSTLNSEGTNLEPLMEENKGKCPLKKFFQRDKLVKQRKCSSIPICNPLGEDEAQSSQNLITETIQLETFLKENQENSPLETENQKGGEVM
ncbi:hypothetical protein SUGI_0727370 [Cryptomeria japonica]|nr:hypothetical protein SUGI_0727370 [Cryptomeria japonica]